MIGLTYLTYATQHATLAMYCIGAFSNKETAPTSGHSFSAVSTAMVPTKPPIDAESRRVYFNNALGAKLDEKWRLLAAQKKNPAARAARHALLNLSLCSHSEGIFFLYLFRDPTLKTTTAHSKLRNETRKCAKARLSTRRYGKVMTKTS